MKKTILFLILFVGPGFVFSASLFYVAGGEVKGLEKTDEEKKISWSGGAKGSLSFIEGCFYEKDQAYSYGLALKSPEISFGSKEKGGSFSADLKGGMILKSGFVSFLGNPGLSSTVSPFSSDERTFSMMGASLPGLSSSFNTRHSAFLETKLNLGNWSISGAAFYCPFRSEMNKNSSLITASFQSSWMPGWKIFPKLKMQAGAVYGRAGYEEKKSDSWYEKNSFYQAGFSSSVLFSFRIGTGPVGGKPEFWIYFHSLFFQNPFARVNQAFRGSTVFGFKGLSFVSEVFYNPYNGLFTLEGKTLDPQISGKATISQKITFGKKNPFSITAGLACFGKENLLYKEDDLKLSGGLRFSYKKTTLAFTAKNKWETVEIKKNGFTETKLNSSAFSATGELSVGLNYFSMEASGTYSKDYDKETGEWKTALSMEGGISLVKLQLKLESGFTKENLKSAKISFSVSGKI